MHGENKKRDQELIKGLKRFLTVKVMLFQFIGSIVMELLMLILISVYLCYLNVKLKFSEFLSLFLYHQNLLIENRNVRTPYFRLIVALVLSFSIFHAFFKTVLLNNIKTDKVVVDTSNLIISETDLLNSHRNICWMYGEIDR